MDGWAFKTLLLDRRGVLQEAQWSKMPTTLFVMPINQWFYKNLANCYDIEDMSKWPVQPVFFGGIDARNK